MTPTLRFALSTALLALVGPAPTALAHGDAPPTGEVVVVNRSGGTVMVRIDGQARTMPPNATTTFRVEPGNEVVRATYTQFGRSFTLENTTVHVRPGRTSTVVLDPEDDARVRVENDTPFDARLVVDGRVYTTLERGESEIVTLPPGGHAFDLVSFDGRSLDHTHLTLRPFTEGTWSAEAPFSVAYVYVASNVGVPTRVLIDGRQVATLEPWEHERIEVSVGVHRVTILDDRGRVLEDERVELSVFETDIVRPDEPRDDDDLVAWHDERDCDVPGHDHRHDDGDASRHEPKR